MTNKDIIIEIEKNTGLKVIEDIYPDCDCFIGVILENGYKFFIEKMTNGGKANVRRRVFTDDEQIREIEKCCKNINKEYCKGYEDGYNAGKEDLQMLQAEIDRLKKNGKTN